MRFDACVGGNLTPSLCDGVRCCAAIQKLFGSFKGDAFNGECCPFYECNDAYLGVLITMLRGMSRNTSSVRREVGASYACCQ